MRGYGRALVVRLPKRIVRTVADRSPVDPVIHVPIDTKLHGPGSCQEWVNRPRLLRELTGTTSTKLVLVDAPAGFGKTTLLAQWRSAATQDRPVAWLSLDRGDDDPGRLWWHVVSALAQACPELGGEDILGALAAQTADIQGTVIPMLVNKLMGSPVKITLVLDDYHVIKDLRCHEQVAALLRHLPPTLLMVLATPVSPPLPLARLRALGEMTEIRMRELRFTRQEATALVRTVSAVDLTVPELTDLVRRTEGWPTGLYLAAMALRGHPSPRNFVHQFTGDNRFVADFLAEEVLAGSQPKSGSSSPGPLFSAGSARRSAMRWPGQARRRRSSIPSSGRISSSYRSTRLAAGSAITSFSRRCSVAGWPGPSQTW